MPTSFDESLVDGQAGVLADLSLMGAWMNALTGRKILAGTPDTPDLATAVAALSAQDLFAVKPGAAVMTFTGALSFPSVHVLEGYGRTLRAGDATAALQWDAPVERVMRGLHVDGNDVATGNLVQLGTGNLGAGSKSCLYDFHIEGSAGTALAVLGIQNSNLFNVRLVDNNAASVGYLIDEGTKNFNLFGCWGSSVTGPSVLGTTTGNEVTPGNAQRTSKITLWGGLFERSSGHRVEDVEEWTGRNVIVNANAAYDTTAAVTLVAGGLREGSAHGPTGVIYEDCQFKDWDSAFLIDGPYQLRVGNNSMGTCLVSYSVTHAGAQVWELAPPQSDAPVRYDDGGTGLIEQHAIRRLYYPPNRITLLGSSLTWTDMPLAATELGGDDDWRVWADILFAKFARLSGHVDVVGVAGATVGLWYNDTDLGFGHASTRRFGTDEIQFLNLGDATGGSYTLTYSGQTTGAIQWDDDETAIAAALVALSNISANGVTVASGTDAAGNRGFAITFGAEWSAQDVALITVTDSTTGGTGVTVAEFLTGAQVEIPIDATGTVKSGWFPITQTALDLIDVLFIPGGEGGDGAADPVISNLTLELA